MPEELNEMEPTTPGTPEPEPEPTPELWREPVSLAEAKAQLRVEFDADDALIAGLITAAREHCEGFMNVSLVAEEGEEPPVVKQVWKQAILLAVANWYQNREQGAFPQAAYQLLWPDRYVPV